jgi:hypothetical protein
MFFPVYIGNDMYCSIRGVPDMWKTTLRLVITDAATDADIVEAPIPVICGYGAVLHNLDNKYIAVITEKVMVVWDIRASRFTGIVYCTDRYEGGDGFVVGGGTHVLVEFSHDQQLVLDLDMYAGKTFIAHIDYDGNYTENAVAVESIETWTDMKPREMPIIRRERIDYITMFMLSPTKKAFKIYNRNRFEFYVYDRETMTGDVVHLDTKPESVFMHSSAVQISHDKFMMFNSNCDDKTLDYIMFDKSLRVIEETGSVPSQMISRIRGFDIQETEVQAFGNNLIMVVGRCGESQNMYVEVIDIVKKQTLYLSYFPHASNVVHVTDNVLYINYFTDVEDIQRVRKCVIPSEAFHGDTYVHGFTTKNAVVFQEVESRMAFNRQRFGTHDVNGLLAVPSLAMRTIQGFL